MTPLEQFYAEFRKPREGLTLIVGSKVYPGREDRRKLYQPDHAVGVDMLPGEGVDIVWDLERLETPLAAGSVSHVECRSVLEHSRRPWLLAANIEAMMCRGATLDLSVPFVWRVHAYPSDYWRFTIEAVRELFPNIEWQALRYATQSRLYEAGEKTERLRSRGPVFFARSEVLGWGVRR